MRRERVSESRRTRVFQRLQRTGPRRTAEGCTGQKTLPLADSFDNGVPVCDADVLSGQWQHDPGSNLA
jgi:hypothetical protein